MKYEQAMQLNRKDRRKLKFVDKQGNRIPVIGITKPFIKPIEEK